MDEVVAVVTRWGGVLHRDSSWLEVHIGYVLQDCFENEDTDSGSL